MKIRKNVFILFIFLLTIVLFNANVKAESQGLTYGCLKYTIDENTNEVTITGLNGVCDVELHIPEIIDNRKVVKIESFAFAYCSELKKVYINTDVEIGLCVFDKSGLEEAIIGEGVTKIWSTEFEGTKNLRKIVLPQSLEEIQDNAFEGCESLESITIPDEVTELGYSVFKDCTKLKKIELPDSIVNMSFGCFSNCTSLTSVKLPNKLEDIPVGTFENCKNLVDFNVPNGVKNIGHRAFKNCILIKEIDLSQVGKINDSAFEGCSNLEKVIFSKKANWLNINEKAFSHCSKLNNIELPEGVYDIGNYTFEYCTSLKELTIPKSVSDFGYYIFRKSGLEKLYVYRDSKAEEYAKENNIPYEYVDEAQLGDVDGNEKINTDDAKIILNYYSGKGTLTESQMKAADVTGDNKVNTDDARKILEFYSGKITKL